MSFICHIHNYTEYNEEWNVFSAFNPSKCTHLEQWAADCAAPGEQSWTSCRSRDSNPQPWVTSGFKSNALSIRPTTALVLHRLTFWAFPLFSPGLPIYSDRLLPAFWPCLPLDILSVCHLPRPLHCPCCWFCLAFITPVTTFEHCLSDHPLSVLKLQLDLTSLPLRYRRLRHLRSSSFITATQPNYGLHRPTPTSSPGMPVYWGVCLPVLWAVVWGTAVWWIAVYRLVWVEWACWILLTCWEV